MKTVVAICEFDVMVFDVGGRLCGKKIVGLKAFDENKVWVKAGYVDARGREANAG